MSSITLDYTELSSSEQDSIVAAMVRATLKDGEFDYMLDDDVESYTTTELFDEIHWYMEDNYCDIEFDIDKCIANGSMHIQ